MKQFFMSWEFWVGTTIIVALVVHATAKRSQ